MTTARTRRPPAISPRTQVRLLLLPLVLLLPPAVGFDDCVIDEPFPNWGGGEDGVRSTDHFARERAIETLVVTLGSKAVCGLPPAGGRFRVCVCSPRHGSKSSNETWAGGGGVALVLEIIVVFQIRPRLHRRLHGGRETQRGSGTEETLVSKDFRSGYDTEPRTRL